jgi:hypothetical protein
MEPSAESEQNPAVSRKTPPSDALTLHECGQPPSSWRGRLLVKRDKTIQSRDVFNGG